MHIAAWTHAARSSGRAFGSLYFYFNYAYGKERTAEVIVWFRLKVFGSAVGPCCFSANWKDCDLEFACKDLVPKTTCSLLI